MCKLDKKDKIKANNNNALRLKKKNSVINTVFINVCYYKINTKTTTLSQFYLYKIHFIEVLWGRALKQTSGVTNHNIHPKKIMYVTVIYFTRRKTLEDKQYDDKNINKAVKGIHNSHSS